MVLGGWAGRGHRLHATTWQVHCKDVLLIWRSFWSGFGNPKVDKREVLEPTWLPGARSWNLLGLGSFPEPKKAPPPRKKEPIWKPILVPCYVNLRIIDKVTLENLRNPTYAVITALNSPRSAPIEGIQPSVEQLSQKLPNKGTTGHKQIYITSLRAKECWLT